MSYRFIFVLFLSFNFKAQVNNLPVKILNLSNEEFLLIDSIANSSTLIGLGESTHGTSEFTVLRKEIFQHLVEKHHFNTFFLEADYNACARVNRYIHGSNDDAKEALYEVKLWPWLTQEMLDLVEWMRSYNFQNDNRLSFVGCDMQLIIDDALELPRFLDQNEEFKELRTHLPNLDFDSKDSNLLQSRKKEWSQFANSFLEKFSAENALIVNSVSQWFECEVLKVKNYNFRDSCMATNIVEYLTANPSSKGIYFAHNGHVGKIYNEVKNEQYSQKRAGHYLDLALKEKYYTIALDFVEGNFNAINYVEDEFLMQEFTAKRSRLFLATKVMKRHNSAKFVSADSLTKNKKIKVHFIGAIFGKSKEGYTIGSFRWIPKRYFDAYIFIKKGTATKLLTMKALKAS
ncbi:MAG: erythromycin esterase family protein [Bacteroidota bacterium]